MISEFTIDQLIELSKVQSHVGILASEELARRLMPPKQKDGIILDIEPKIDRIFDNATPIIRASGPNVPVIYYNGERIWTDKNMETFGVICAHSARSIPDLLKEYKESAHD
jgi:hypothetical protein